MKKLKIPKKLLDKRIPTLLGMGVLVVSLIAGTLLIGKGGGVFAPRASVETTPKKVKITNVHDTSFTISFITDSKVVGFVKYGTDGNSLKSQAGDDRDQISGTVEPFQTHHITVRGLQQNETYYYVIGTGSGSIFDDNGQPFRIKTASRNGAPAAAKTIYGSVTNEAGAPAEGSIVYVDVNGARTMSSQIKASGSWAIPLSNARTNDGSSYAVITDANSININVQGPLASQTASFTTTVENSQPVAGISFGQNTVETGNIVNSKEDKESGSQESENDKSLTERVDESGRELRLINDGIEDDEDNTDQRIGGGSGDEGLVTDDETLSGREVVLDSLLDNDQDSTESATEEKVVEVTEVNLEIEEQPTITTANPVIIGKAPAGVTVSISVHSDTQIQENIIADENGEFILDIATLSESLEPGEHTVTYSYTDPDTGEIVEKTVEFTVADTSQQLADAGDSEEYDEPYGSENPYPIGGEASESAEASNSAEATEEARTSQPATDEGIPVSGSVGTTLALVFGGLFFIISGLWSLWISTQLEKEPLI